MKTLQLTAVQRARLHALTARGDAPARVVRRAHILRLLDEGESATMIADILDVSAETVRLLRIRFFQGGLENALWDRPRSGRPIEINESAQQRIVALTCSAPPSGYARWTVRLLTESARKQHFADHLGRETVRTILKHHDLHPWREKNVVRSQNRSRLPHKDGRCAGNLRASI